jgi:hypothetical protein
LRPAISGVRKQPSLFSTTFAARSRQRSPLHCPPVRSARLASTRSRYGISSPASWSIPNWSQVLTLRNSMRPVALGRKNWLHIGSPQAGPKVAAILSVVESCRRLQVPVRDYFSTVLPGLADLPIRCLPDLTPAVWAPGIHRRKRPG